MTEQEENRAAYLAQATAYKAMREAARTLGKSTRAIAVPSSLLHFAQGSGYQLREVAEQLGVSYGVLRQTASSRGIAWKGNAPTDGRRDQRREDVIALMRDSLGIDYDKADADKDILLKGLSAAIARYDRTRAAKVSA